MVDFPSVVYGVAAPAVEGDFASANPRWNVMAGPGAIVAGPSGVTIGRFAWLDTATRTIASPFGSGPPSGFVHREMQGLITAYLSEAGFTIPPGFAVTLHHGGDFWAKNNGSGEALYGHKVYVNTSTGAVSFGPPGAPAQAASVTASIAPSTGSFTGSVANNILTIAAVGSGVAVPGGVLSGTNVASGTQVVAQLTGAAGGIGTYSVNIPDQTVASTTITETYGTMTVSAVASGAIAVGQAVSGVNVTAGSVVTAFGSGTGGLGTYIVNPTQTAASATVTSAATVETSWRAWSTGQPGELVKISSTPPV